MSFEQRLRGLEIVGIPIVEGDHGHALRQATLMDRVHALCQGQGGVLLRENGQLLGKVLWADAQLVRVNCGVRDSMIQQNEGLRRHEVLGPPNRSAHFLRKKHYYVLTRCCTERTTCPNAVRTRRTVFESRTKCGWR